MTHTFKFYEGDHVRISNPKTNFQKMINQTSAKNYLRWRKVKDTSPGIYAIKDLDAKEIAQTSFGQEL